MLAHPFAFVLAFYLPLSIAVPAHDTACHISKSISWANCRIFGYNDTLETVKPQCGYFTVPADYKNCAAGSVKLAVVRRPAVVKPRLGTLFFNPGGPGGSGIETILEEGAVFHNIVASQYDIVSWDPRGVGFTSLQISCFNSTDEEAPYFQPDSILSYGPQAKGNFTNPQHNDPDEVAFWKKERETDTFIGSIASACARRSGASLTYIGSAAAARDMLAMSDAIEGPGKLVNYWGISYGTVIGAYFTNMFPNRVGRVILDGVLNPVWWAQQPQYKMWSGSIADVTLVLDEFARACAEAGPKYCAIATANSTSADIITWLQNFMDFAYDHPLAQITSALVRAVIHGLLYVPTVWSDAAKQALETYQALVAAANTSSTIETRSSFYASLQRQQRRWTRRPVGLYSLSPRAIAMDSPAAVETKQLSTRGFAAEEPQFDFAAPTVAIACGDAIDTSHVMTRDVFREIIHAASTVSQMIGPQWSPEMYCHRWPVRAVERYHGPWNRKFANKVLVIGNKGDPITPLASAKKLIQLFGPKNAALLERDGYGHTSFAEESVCTNNVINKYLIHGKLPHHGTVCATNKNYFGVPNISNNSDASWVGNV